MQPLAAKPSPSAAVRRARYWRRLGAVCVLLLAAISGWLGATIHELRTGQRLWPWSAYALCGQRQPTSLPSRVRIGVYEEFPNPWRLTKLRQLPFPVTLAVAAPSRAEFLRLQAEILRTYPQVRDVVFWPVLSEAEGYYPGAWSEPAGVQRLTTEASDLPVLWDIEVPRGAQHASDFAISRWWSNRATLETFYAGHNQPIYIWRTYRSMGLNPTFLRLTALHYDPLDYPAVRLHLDLYTTGAGQDANELQQLLRCGVERYGARFIPAFGVLNDGEGPAELFVPSATLARDLRVARAAGVSEIWFFGANGLNEESIATIATNLPVEVLDTER